MVEGAIEAIFVTPRGGTNMESVSEVEALADLGLKGDRYCAGTGYWSGIDECQVTLIDRLCENSIGALRLSSGRTVKYLILLTSQPVRAEALEA